MVICLLCAGITIDGTSKRTCHVLVRDQDDEVPPWERDVQELVIKYMQRQITEFKKDDQEPVI
jgi:hypothetical protein